MGTGQARAGPHSLADRPGSDHRQALGDRYRFPDVPLSDVSLHTVYAPGTFQNKANRPGRYEFYLAHELETGLFPNGSYVLEAEALDEQENVGRALFAFTIRNGS